MVTTARRGKAIDGTNQSRAIQSKRMAIIFQYVEPGSTMSDRHTMDLHRDGASVNGSKVDSKTDLLNSGLLKADLLNSGGAGTR